MRFLSQVLFLLAIIFSSLVAQADTTYKGVVVTPGLDQAGIDVLKSWKVNIVRYTLVWGDQVAADNSDMTTYNAWLDAALAQFDPVLTLLEQNGIKVSLALHTPPGAFSDRGSHASQRVFEQQWAQDGFIATWDKIARRYLGRAGIWNYELLNEPAQAVRPQLPLLDWNALAQKAADTIRAIDATTPLVMGPVYGKITRLSAMRTLNTTNTMYTVHYYEPWKFTHQGVFSTTKKSIVYPYTGWNRNTLMAQLRDAFKFQQKHKTRIYIGEFSVARWAPKGSGARYLRDLLYVFKRYNFHWTYHAFREANSWDLELTNDMNSDAKSTKPSDRLQAILSYLK